MVMSYSSMLFRENKLILNMIMVFVQILGCLTSSQVTKYFGLKKMLLGGQIALVVNLVLLAIFDLIDQTTVMSVFIIVFVYIFALTLGTSTWAAIPLLLAKK
jgi:MFS-type transporter involved in bile tolerance (Atg22 family)